MLPTSLAQRLIQRFPKISYGFAYGSGVKKQTGYDDKAQKEAMIDLILCVDDAFDWHKQNLKLNPKDYSLLRLFGPKFIAEYQDYAAGVYFNTLIPIDDKCTIKYGVIQTTDLCGDLHHWSDLYVAGRLHKPVETLVAPTNQEIINGLELNLDSALHFALLTLGREFTYSELFETIAGISYYGDFRMFFGEKKDKVQNIVEPQLNAFLKLYAPSLKKLSNQIEVPRLDYVTDKRIEQDKSPTVLYEHMKALPSTMIQMIEEGADQSIEKIAHKTDYQVAMKSALGALNWSTSLSQSVKNILSAGIWKALRYSTRKGMKTFS